jgi:replicative DNA helicase
MAMINCNNEKSMAKIDIAETRLLSYINKNGVDALKALCPRIDTTYFENERNIRLFKVFTELTKRNVTFDVYSVSIQDPKSAPAYIMLNEDDNTNAEEIRYFFELIDNKKRVLDIHRKLEKALSISASWEVGEYMDYVNSSITEIHLLSDDDHVEKDRFTEGAIAEWNDNFKAMQFAERAPCTSTGIKPLDLGLGGGLYDGDMYTIAARTSVGKTALAVNLFVNIGLQHVDAVYYSNEMSRDRIIDRCNSMLSKVEYQKLKNPKTLTLDELARVAEARDKLRKLPLSVKVIRDCNWFTIENDIRKNHRLHNSKVVFIDYIQQYKAGKKSTREDIEYMTSRAKQMAIELKISFVLVAQLNRSLERDQIIKEREPQLSDLKDCGSIEQDSDAVLMMYVQKQQGEDNIKDHADREVRGIFAKNRNGQLGRLDFLFTPQFNKFSGSKEEHEIFKSKVERMYV